MKRPSAPVMVIAMTLVLVSLTDRSVLADQALGGETSGDQAWGNERVMPAPISHDEAAKLGIAALAARGRKLFLAKFTAAEGAGRPGATGAIIPTKGDGASLPAFFRTAGPDSNACRGCHNDPDAGGAGEFVSNAFVSEGFSDADFDTVDPQFSNERGTPALNGSGIVELLAREMTKDLRAQRRAALRKVRQGDKPIRLSLNSKGIDFGQLILHPDGFVDVSQLKGIDQDLILRPFSQKGVFTSLRQFTINALNAHHGMQAVERFGVRYTDKDDFDNDGVKDEIGTGNITALVVFQALLPPPVEVSYSQPDHEQAVNKGRALFSATGCVSCHKPSLPLENTEFSEPNPYNPAGNLRPLDVKTAAKFKLDVSGFERDAKGRVLVPVFSDFKRHVIADATRPHFANELLAQRFVNRDAFLTARLWGLGSTAPYGHRGDLTTIREAIGHHGGEAEASRAAFDALDKTQQRQMIAFLQSLRLTQAEVRP